VKLKKKKVKDVVEIDKVKSRRDERGILFILKVGTRLTILFFNRATTRAVTQRYGNQ